MKRVIAGYDGKGNSVIHYVGGPAKVLTGSDIGLHPGFEMFDIWATDGPSLSAQDRTASAEGFTMDLGVGGTRFRSLTFPPENQPQVMHRTNTIDYLTVVCGSIDLTMQNAGEVHLEAGDIVVELGAVHQWWNRGDQPCIVTFVQIGVEPRDDGA
jgi:hypothetical protein